MWYNIAEDKNYNTKGCFIMKCVAVGDMMIPSIYFRRELEMKLKNLKGHLGLGGN